jgi:regulator of sigma E protease
MIVNLLAFFFVLGVLVVLHEAGHFVMARLLGAPVEVFSFGFGRRLWGFEYGGTDYRISLVPFGGYVRIVGLGPDESTVVGEEGDEVELLDKWKRALILLAGPLTNIVTAVGFLAAAFMVGIEVPAYQDSPPVVGWVEPDSPAMRAGLRSGDLVVSVDDTRMETWRDLEMSIWTSGGHQVDLEVERSGRTLRMALTPERVTRYGFGYSGILPPLDATVVQLQQGSPAEAAGLRPDDRIVAVDDQPVEQFYDLIRLISPHPGEPITLRVERAGAPFEVEVTPRDEGGEGKIGVGLVLPLQLKKLGPVSAVKAGAVEAVRLTVETFRVLRKLITRKASIRQLSGPIDIARISGEAARSGFHRLVWLMGLISLQLGIFNLLPIPILDGGHLTILGFEAVIRRDLSFKVKERILEVGLYLLLILMVVVLINDVVKILPDSLYGLFDRSS